MKIIERMMTNNRCFSNAVPLDVSGLMLHSVGVSQPKAEVFARSWDNSEAKVSVHAFIDGLTGEIYQTLPWDCKAWHCGPLGGNSRYIGVEMCEPACIKYSESGGGTFICQDRDRALEVVERTYRAAVELFAYLCGKYRLDPLADGVIISHSEGHRRNIASNHADPEHLWNGLAAGYTMDGFRRAVAEAMVAPEDGHISAALPEAAAPVEAAPGGGRANSEIRAGCVVTIAPDAVYYGGRLMPLWVKQDRWIVKSVQGDRVVISENTSHTHAIRSAVNIRFLRAEGCS